MLDWNECEHEWEEIDNQFTNEWFTDVRCVKCRCPGSRDDTHGDVFWPVT